MVFESCGGPYVPVMFRHACPLVIRSSHVAPRVRGAVSQRRRLCAVSRRTPQARRLCLSGLRWPEGVGAGSGEADVGMRGVPTADLGDRRHDHAPQPPGAEDLVSRRPYRRHPLQRHLGPSVAGATGHRQLQDRLAAAPQAPARHGRPRAELVPSSGRG